MHYDYEVDTDEYINTINDGRQSGTPGTHVDVYWYATDEDNLPDPSYWGVARCMVTMSNNKSLRVNVKGWLTVRVEGSGPCWDR